VVIDKSKFMPFSLRKHRPQFAKLFTSDVTIFVSHRFAGKWHGYAYPVGYAKENARLGKKFFEFWCPKDVLAYAIPDERRIPSTYRGDKMSQQTPTPINPDSKSTTKGFVASLSKSAGAGAKLVGLQKERTKLTTLTLPAAYIALGRDCIQQKRHLDSAKELIEQLRTAHWVAYLRRSLRVAVLPPFRLRLHSSSTAAPHHPLPKHYSHNIWTKNGGTSTWLHPSRQHSSV
jgi:hypothetical protein